MISGQTGERALMKFPGMRTWAWMIAGVLWLTSLLQIWADDGLTGHALDLTSFFIGRPLLLLTGLVLGIAVWSWALRIRPLEAVVTGWRWMVAFLLLPTGINLLFRFLGFSVQSWSYVAGREWILTLLSGGWYPHLFATPGTLLTMMAVAWFVGWTVWHWREEKTRALITGVVTYVSFSLLLSVPSIIAWFGVEDGAIWWRTSGYAVQRGMISLSNQQYWWQSLYDRFPGAVGGEAQTSETLLLSALAYLFLAALILWVRRIEVVKGIRDGRIWIRELPGSVTAIFLATIFFGWLLGLHSLIGAGKGIVFLIASLLALVVAGSVALVLNPSSPLEMEDRSFLRVLSGIGAWLLGWPVFIMVFLLFFLVIGRDFLREKERNFFPQVVLEGGVFMATFLAAWGVGSQKGSFAEIPTRVFLGLWLFFCVQGTLSHGRSVVENGLPPWLASLGQKIGLQRGWALLILLSYVILPLMTGWFSWFLLALPVGFIAALLSFGRSPSVEKHLRLVATLFLLVSYFFLSVRGFHS